MPTLVRIEHCYVRIEPVPRHSTSLPFRLGRGIFHLFNVLGISVHEIMIPGIGLGGVLCSEFKKTIESAFQWGACVDDRKGFRSTRVSVHA